MPTSVRLSVLAAMSPAEFRGQVAALARAQQQAMATGSEPLDARIRVFERRYEMTSEALVERLRRGEQRETAEICEWLLLLAARKTELRAVR